MKTLKDLEKVKKMAEEEEAEARATWTADARAYEKMAEKLVKILQK